MHPHKHTSKIPPFPNTECKGYRLIWECLPVWVSLSLELCYSITPPPNSKQSQYLAPKVPRIPPVQAWCHKNTKEGPSQKARFDFGRFSKSGDEVWGEEQEELASALESPGEYSFGLLYFCFQISLITINSSCILIRFGLSEMKS